VKLNPTARSRPRKAVRRRQSSGRAHALPRRDGVIQGWREGARSIRASATWKDGRAFIGAGTRPDRHQFSFIVSGPRDGADLADPREDHPTMTLMPQRKATSGRSFDWIAAINANKASAPLYILVRGARRDRERPSNIGRDYIAYCIPRTGPARLLLGNWVAAREPRRRHDKASLSGEVDCRFSFTGLDPDC